MWNEAVEAESSTMGKEGRFRLDQARVGERVLRGDERYCVRTQRIKLDTKEVTRFVKDRLSDVC